MECKDDKYIAYVGQKYNKCHGPVFAQKYAEAKYLKPLGLSLRVFPQRRDETFQRLSSQEEFDLFSALHFVKYKLSKCHWKQRDRYFQNYLFLRNRAISCNWPLITKCVLAYIERSSIEADIHDLHERGYFALISAVDGFDPWKGFCLSTYAYSAIQKSFYRKYKKSVNTLPIEDFVEAIYYEDKDEGYWIEVLKKLLRTDLLSMREKKVLAYRFGCFGLNDHCPGSRYSLQAVGLQMQLSKERVRQIQNIAIEKIRKHFADLN